MQHDPLLMIFTGVLALAVVIQGIIFFLIYKSIRQLTVRMDILGNDLIRNAEVVTEKVNEGLAVIKNVAQDLKPITEKLADTTDIVHKRVKDIDCLLEEVTSSARMEILRVQETFRDASCRIQDAIDILRNSIIAPLNEINAISRAIRVAIDVLFRRRKGPSGTAGPDEEMFI
jgi:uncharacterized protein YoxC